MVECYHVTVMPAFLVSDTSTLRDKDVKRNGSWAAKKKKKKTVKRTRGTSELRPEINLLEL